MNPINLNDVYAAKKILDEQPIPKRVIRDMLSPDDFKEYLLLEYVNKRIKEHYELNKQRNI